VTPVLDRQRIAEAALELVTAEGSDRLTMARLARRLGVATSALYNHIGGRTDLTSLLQDAVMGLVDVSSFAALGRGETSMEDALAVWARSYREVFSGYPSLIPYIATMPISGAPETRQMYDAVAAGLQRGGVPSHQVVPVIIAFESFLFGSALDVHAPATIFTTPPDEAGATHFSSAVEAFTSSVTAAGEQGGGADAAAGARNPYADAPFALGLEALIRATLQLVP
jgi:AcrR family transcriptional regulator